MGEAKRPGQSPYHPARKGAGAGWGPCRPHGEGERVAELKELGLRLGGEDELPPRSTSLLSQLEQEITLTLAITGDNPTFPPPPHQLSVLASH